MLVWLVTGGRILSFTIESQKKKKGNVKKAGLLTGAFRPIPFSALAPIVYGIFILLLLKCCE